MPAISTAAPTTGRAAGVRASWLLAAQNDASGHRQAALSATDDFAAAIIEPTGAMVPSSDRPKS